MSLKQATADLSVLPDKLLEAAIEGALEIAYLILGSAQIHVRVKTGSLRDSGRIERGGKTKHFAVIRVRFGGYILNPETGKLVDYAAIVEQRYPYLRPAVLEYRGQMADIIRRFCLEAMKEVESHGVLRFS